MVFLSIDSYLVSIRRNSVKVAFAGYWGLLVVLHITVALRISTSELSHPPLSKFKSFSLGCAFQSFIICL